MNRKLIAALAVTASVLATQAHATTVFESEAFSGGGRNDTTATAQSIGGLSTGGTITVYGSRMLALPGVDSADFYSFTLLGNGIVSFDVTTPTGWSYGNDPVLAVFSSTGARLGVDDDAGPGWDSFLQLSLHVGTYYAAVSGFPDFGFSGGGNSNFPYTLNLVAASSPVPEPGIVSLAALAFGASALATRRKRKEADQAGPAFA